MGGTIEGPDGAGEALPGAQGGSGALGRKSRSFGCSDGGQDEHAEDFQKQILQEVKELEEQKTKDALELVHKKHKLVKWEGERERARTLQRLESSRAIGQWSGVHDNSSSVSCSSSLAFDTDEAMSASSKMARDADEAMGKKERKRLVEHGP